MHEDIIEHVAFDRGRQSGKRSGGESMWINIEDQSPEEGRLVLYFFDMCGGAFLGYYFGRDEQYPSHNDHVFGSPVGFLTGDVTHWMYVDSPKGYEYIDEEHAERAKDLAGPIDDLKGPYTLDGPE